MLASSISLGPGVGWQGSFVQGSHMAYSSALNVKSFAFCSCSWIVHVVILFPSLSSVDEFNEELKLLTLLSTI